MRVLVLNCGSSSLKFELIDLDPSGGRDRILGRGTFEEIGHGGRNEFIDGSGVLHEQSSAAKDHPAAALEAIAWLETVTGDSRLKAGAIVHRIVHGGPDLTAPVIADAKVISALEAASIFAPLHNPLSVATLRAVAERLPEPPPVIVADTFFHQTMPEEAREYALPRALAARHHLRHYGFHGIAHAWMMERYAKLKGVAPAAVNLITLQLGAGCSVCAIRAGRSIDTSMGLTPMEGLMMATRSGDLDPAIVTFLIEHEGVTASKVEEILNRESGLLGVSGVSDDLRAVEAAAKSGNLDAALALRMFCYRARKYIGAYMAALGGAEALVFGGGIGEHSASSRANICAELKPLGVELDPERNAQTLGREGRISADGSRLEVFVTPVDEELYMARIAARLVAAPPGIGVKAVEQAAPERAAGAGKFETQRGRPLPLGAWPIAGGVNFALFSRHATSVELLLYRSADAAPVTIALDSAHHRTGDIWHIWVRGLEAGDCYGYRVDGPYRPEVGLRFNRMRLLIDAYARALRIPPNWDFARARGDDPAIPDGLSERDNSPFAARGIVVARQFNSPALAELGHPWSRTVIYETHVRGLTIDPSSAAANPGTYLGVIEKLPYLKELGVTAIELLPVQEFNPNENPRTNPLTGARLINYWGYNPVAFFAAATWYAKTAAPGHVEEFRAMVAQAHRAGIEVILDVVFNHTAEGNEYGPTLSFRGLDNPIYYLLAEDLRHYRDYSGTGNTVNCNHPVVRELILDCLRQWTVDMGVDGFRFDLASILGRDRDGRVASNPPLLEAIAEDPILSSVKLIAEAWDLGGAYQLGSFPGQRWSEWNGRFRDDVRRFWRGDRGMAGAFASRLCGSADIYQRYGKQPLNSINFVTCHDGMTLNDLVSYAHKHNEANGEDNRDGAAEDYGCNYGVEGPTTNPEINRIRLRQAKNLMATLMLSRGVPMILGGDEFLRTQRGNNNAYCQDNEISWYDWRLVERHREFHEFTRRMIAFRANHPVLCAERFYAPAEVIWFNPSGASPDWSGSENRLGCIIIAGAPTDGIMAMLFNAEREVAGFSLPASAVGAGWRVVIDTAAAAPGDVHDFASAPHLETPAVAVAARSLVVLEARKI